MNKITKEQAQEWLGVVQSGLIGREYRDVFLRLPEILQSYLAQEEELQKERNFVEAHRLLVQKLKTANQVLESYAFEPTPIELSEEVTRLTADNQALQDSLVEQRRRMGAENDDLRESLMTIQTAAHEEIKKLKAENQALKGSNVQLKQDYEDILDGFQTSINERNVRIAEKQELKAAIKALDSELRRWKGNP